jgi:hypothetical protein
VNTEHPDVDQEAVSCTLFDHAAPFPRVLRFETTQTKILTRHHHNGSIVSNTGRAEPLNINT